MRPPTYDDHEALEEQIAALQERCRIAETNLRNVKAELDTEIRVLEKLTGDGPDALPDPTARRFYGDACRRLKRIRGWADFHKVEADEKGEG